MASNNNDDRMEVDDAAAAVARSQYDHVRYKKKDGRLSLTDDGIVFRTNNASAAAPLISLPWSSIVKHQVSPVTYPKALLKLVCRPDGTPSGAAAAGNNNNNNSNNDRGNNNQTFQFQSRVELDRIRTEITERLQNTNGNGGSNSHAAAALSSSRKRRLSQTTTKATNSSNTSFGDMDPTALAVTRSSLLAAHPTLRQQHKYLVEETQTVTESDFWETHRDLLEEEYARIAGMARAGTSSLLQSHLPTQGRVVLGVEEMRQIFIMYPAVHKAYEEKVPLELSDEQFWRKYLESEYFHRDRGRMGTAARNHAGNKKGPGGDDAAASSSTQQGGDNNKKGAANAGPTFEEQEARAAAVGTDDMFSRYDQKLREANDAVAVGGAAAAAASASDNGGATNGKTGGGGDGAASGPQQSKQKKQWGRQLAVGQFDLASTLETERGMKLLAGPQDNHPPNMADDGEKGSRVIRKYNRHWAMVLHPDEARAGANLTEVARNSVYRVMSPDDPDAQAHGGEDAEMYRLVDYANASPGQANHAMGTGLLEGSEEHYEPLTLRNVESYYTAQQHADDHNDRDGTNTKSEEELTKTHADMARFMQAKTEALAQAVTTAGTSTNQEQPGAGQAPPVTTTTLQPSQCFPPAQLGKELLSALTKKMAQDSKTEAASVEIVVNKLPAHFRSKLQFYFRRRSQLLRHFFGLRRLEAAQKAAVAAAAKSASNNNSSTGLAQRLKRIVRGMENFYREIEQMRKELPQDETGQMMSKMCLPIMDQLDWAFKLHREGSSGSGGGGGGGGFVDVE